MTHRGWRTLYARLLAQMAECTERETKNDDDLSILVDARKLLARIETRETAQGAERPSWWRRLWTWITKKEVASAQEEEKARG